MDGKTATRFYRLYRHWLAGRLSTHLYVALWGSLRAQQKTWRNN
jgi:hypothetical protein